MRGRQSDQSSMLFLVNVEERVPQDHPLRPIKKMADEALRRISRSLDAMYSSKGRPSVPPERLLKAMVLMALYGIRSEVLLCEQLQYNILFRWFLDMDMVEAPFDHCAFSDNRERFLAGDVAGKFFRQVVRFAKEADLMSDEHFSVDGTLIEAWASLKSFRPKDDDHDDHDDNNGWADFKGKKRSNETHESKTDPEAKLARKGNGKEAKLSFAGHVLMENRNGLIAEAKLTEANGHAERRAALELLSKQRRAKTVGGDAGYNTRDFVDACRKRGITPHVAGKRKYSAVDGRTTRHRGYTISQRIRKRIEQIMGWSKDRGNLRKTRLRGVANNNFLFTVIATAYNLLRISRLTPTPA
jgi:transposase